MAERKVLNKYYPPDFDPAAIPRSRLPKDRQMKVRMMLPMSLRCKTCGNYMYKGTKFNSRKEDVEGEDYLGITLYRFYFRCSHCSAEVTMKTDPKNSDYEVEHGASRNYEPWREKEMAAEQSKKMREEEEKGNAMKALENRTIDSKREMDVLAALDELKSLNARKGKLSHDEILVALKNQKDAEDAPGEEVEDEEAVKALFQRERLSQVKRLKDDSDSDSGERAKRNRTGQPSSSTGAMTPTQARPGDPESMWDRNLVGSLTCPPPKRKSLAWTPQFKVRRKTEGPPLVRGVGKGNEENGNATKSVEGDEDGLQKEPHAGATSKKRDREEDGIDGSTKEVKIGGGSDSDSGKLGLAFLVNYSDSGGE
ncbi:unnamed protein product [Ostreobium quekettii]|uniref:Splicing factor YJU2 n=1 Tax=Ostreobium quekettii TaxID=121088 RepID=A0A8S1JHG7_9CHLO|nr:unnamed protein product [Ostreobium quekettii]